MCNSVSTFQLYKHLSGALAVENNERSGITTQYAVADSRFVTTATKDLKDLLHFPGKPK
jgi:hypothetical protein